MSGTQPKRRVLLMPPLLPWLRMQLVARYHAQELPPAGPAREALLESEGAEFEALVTSAGVGVDAALIDRLPRLRVISSFGVGLDRIPTGHAAARGIAVGYTPDVLNDCVADHAFALLLAVARRIGQAERHVRTGSWAALPPSPFPLGRRVSGARLGIVGLGRIGRTIARRAIGFDMEIRYHARRPVADAPWRHEPDLRALAQWCDFLVVITAGGPATRHLVDEGVLQALGPRGFLVNVARGSVVDEAALVRALLAGSIAGAGLDVYQDEPHVPPALLDLNQVVLAPHIASATTETRQAMAQRVLDNLNCFFAGEPLPSAVTAA